MCNSQCSLYSILYNDLCCNFLYNSMFGSNFFIVLNLPNLSGAKHCCLPVVRFPFREASWWGMLWYPGCYPGLKKQKPFQGFGAPESCLLWTTNTRCVTANARYTVFCIMTCIAICCTLVCSALIVIVLNLLNFFLILSLIRWNTHSTALSLCWCSCFWCPSRSGHRW